MSDEAFIRVLNDEHGGAVFTYALWLAGGDRQMAEDLVQETMVRAWRNAQGIEPASIRRWLYAVTRHVAVDAYRAARSRPQQVGDGVLEGMPAEDTTDRALRALTVTEALASLKPHHLAVIIELYYRDLSVAATAAALGIPPGTVKSRANSALRVLAKALQERGVTGNAEA